jgi:hypothetical protein
VPNEIIFELTPGNNRLRRYQAGGAGRNNVAVAADAAEGVTGFAPDAFSVGVDRAIALPGTLALFDQQHPVIGMLTQIIGRKQAGGTAADDNDIIFGILNLGHCDLLFAFSRPPLSQVSKAVGCIPIRF